MLRNAILDGLKLRSSVRLKVFIITIKFPDRVAFVARHLNNDIEVSDIELLVSTCTELTSLIRVLTASWMVIAVCPGDRMTI
jgi:hypothetical protein